MFIRFLVRDSKKETKFISPNGLWICLVLSHWILPIWRLFLRMMRFIKPLQKLKGIKYRGLMVFPSALLSNFWTFSRRRSLVCSRHFIELRSLIIESQNCWLLSFLITEVQALWTTSDWSLSQMGPQTYILSTHCQTPQHGGLFGELHLNNLYLGQKHLWWMDLGLESGWFNEEK